MKKFILGAFLLLFIQSCAVESDTDTAVSPAGSLGAGLSLSNANEISPFLYRASNGTAVLFFSSDRPEGTNTRYKIYKAAMNADESFQPPVVLGSLVNDPAFDLVSPVVFVFQGQLYLTAIERSAAATNVVTWSLDPDCQPLAQAHSFAFSARGLGVYQALDSFAMLVANGTTNVYGYYYYAAEKWSNVTTNITATAVNDISGYNVIDIINSTANSYFLLGGTNGQLSGMAYNAGFFFDTNGSFMTNGLSLNTNNFAIPAYSSVYSDITPFIDVRVGMLSSKVYFASSREGTYDLFRYNRNTFESVLPR